MAPEMDWHRVEQRLEQLSHHAALSSTVDAMKRVLHVLRKDPSLRDTQRGMSHAALRLGYPGVIPFVLVAWTKHEGFTVSIWDPEGEVRDRRIVAEKDVPEAIHGYLNILRQ